MVEYFDKDTNPPQMPEFTLSDTTRFKHMSYHALLSLGAHRMVPQDYPKDPMTNFSQAHPVCGMMLNPSIMAAAWEHLLLYGDSSKVNTDILERDTVWRNWIRKNLERPADAFVAKIERGDLPATKSQLIAEAETAIADESARFDRKLILARFTRHFAKEMKAVLLRYDEVIFDGEMSKRNAPELEPVVKEEWLEPYPKEKSLFPPTRDHVEGELQEFFAHKRQQMESRVWLAVGKVLGADAAIESKLHLLPDIAADLQRNTIGPDGRLTKEDAEALWNALHSGQWQPSYDANGQRVAHVYELPNSVVGERIAESLKCGIGIG